MPICTIGVLLSSATADHRTASVDATESVT
jgi:hypothetical protein